MSVRISLFAASSIITENILFNFFKIISSMTMLPKPRQLTIGMASFCDSGEMCYVTYPKWV